MKIIKLVLIVMAIICFTSCNSKDIEESNYQVEEKIQNTRFTDEKNMNYVELTQPKHSIATNYDQWSILDFNSLIESEYDVVLSINGERTRLDELYFLSESESYHFEFYSVDGDSKSKKVSVIATINPKELNVSTPELKFAEKYSTSDLLVFDDLVSSKYPFVISINDEVVNESSIKLDKGDYYIECYAHYKDIVSGKTSKRITVVKDYDTASNELEFHMYNYYREGDEIWFRVSAGDPIA